MKNITYASGTEFMDEVAVIESADITQLRGNNSNDSNSTANQGREEDPGRGTLFTSSGLMSARIKSVRFVVDGLIPEGFTLLAGIPKSGKSWLALNICACVARGESVMNGFDTNPCNVLYIGYEDSYARLQSRMHNLGRGLAIDKWPDNLYINNDAPGMNEGGFDYLQTMVKELDLGFIVIDTMFKFTGGTQGSHVYSADYAVSDALHKFAIDNHIAVLAVHHARKMRNEEGDHFISYVSGSYGVSAGADTVIVISKKLTGPYIAATGRDIDEFDSPAHFDKDTGLWMLQKEKGTTVEGATSLSALDAFRKNERGYTITEYAAMEKLDYDVAKKRIYRLRDRNMLEQEGPLFKWKASIT